MKATDCRVIGIWGGAVLRGGAVSRTFRLLFISTRSPGVPEDLGQEQRRATGGKILAPVPQVPNKKSTEFGGNKQMALSSPGEDEHIAGWHHRACALLWEWGEALYPQGGLECFSFFFCKFIAKSLCQMAQQPGVVSSKSSAVSIFLLRCRAVQGSLGVGVRPVQTIIYVKSERN